MAQEQPDFTPHDSPLNLYSVDDAAHHSAELPPAEPLPIEICLSPLLWSDSVGVFLDG
jgi:hypothetical protein